MYINFIESSFYKLLKSAPKHYPIISIILISLLFSANNITNKSMPSGDAKRIYPFIEFVENEPRLVPTWNPYKLGGVPTLADPERFVGLSWLVSANQETSFIQFNAVLLILHAMLGISFYCFAKKVAIGEVGSFVSAIIFISSQLVFNALKSGRVESLLSMIMVC